MASTSASFTEEHVQYTPVKGEHFYQGVRLGPIFTAANLDRRSQLELKSADTLIIGYPKSGKHKLQYKAPPESIAIIQICFLCRNNMAAGNSLAN